jgi:hypothetical protein
MIAVAALVALPGLSHPSMAVADETCVVSALRGTYSFLSNGYIACRETPPSVSRWFYPIAAVGTIRSHGDEKVSRSVNVYGGGQDTHLSDSDSYTQSAKKIMGDERFSTLASYSLWLLRRIELLALFACTLGIVLLGSLAFRRQRNSVRHSRLQSPRSNVYGSRFHPRRLLVARFLWEVVLVPKHPLSTQPKVAMFELQRTQTSEEHSKVLRARYQVHLEEFGYTLPNANHAEPEI